MKFYWCQILKEIVIFDLISFWSELLLSKVHSESERRSVMEPKSSRGSKVAGGRGGYNRLEKSVVVVWEVRLHESSFIGIKWLRTVVKNEKLRSNGLVWTLDLLFVRTYKPTYHREKNGSIFSSFVACYRHVFFKFRFQQHCNANFHVKCFRPLKEAICVYVCVCLDELWWWLVLQLHFYIFNVALVV